MWGDLEWGGDYDKNFNKATKARREKMAAAENGASDGDGGDDWDDPDDDGPDDVELRNDDTPPAGVGAPAPKGRLRGRVERAPFSSGSE